MAIALVLSAAGTARSEILPEQVLVVFNSQAGDASALKDSYLAAHPDIPPENVFDLNRNTILTSNLSHAAYKSQIRDPIRDYLLSGTGPGPSDILAIVLIRPIPHRLQDTDNGPVGDNPNNANTEFSAGDATFGSIDAELTLLWQELDAGEAGGQMDSFADNMIDNPYHTSMSGVDTFDRTNIMTAKSFLNRSNIAWIPNGAGATLLTPGDMYLVCRIDGTTLADAEATIERARALRVNKALVRIILDEFNVSTNQDLDDDRLFTTNDPFRAGDDYEETAAILSADGWDVRYDGTFDFISSAEETMPIIAYASYGENHDAVAGLGEDPPGTATYIDGFNFPPGAIFNTIESYNGRALNGLGTAAGLEQLADFITAGGTFAVGNVWEPFSFSIPDNEFLFVNFLVHGMTWGEAAYASLPCLSWQQIVVGDPLAKAVILNDPGLPKGDLNGDGNVNGLDIASYVDLVLNGPAAYYAAFPALDPVARGDFTGDYLVSLDDLADFLTAVMGG
ncbi:MAG: hypothetical protein DCC65_02800 [Planctomycetota bacterium]|nr:MAG: hypothetical protein DCC65_02800 [Planctomycetota bacterium]